MSEYIDNSTKRKELLKHLLLQLHEGAPAEVLRGRLIEVLSGIPYNEVVEVEQELINAGALTPDEILDFCDLHTAVLDGSIDLEGAKTVPAGHPVDTLKKENSFSVFYRKCSSWSKHVYRSKRKKPRNTSYEFTRFTSFWSSK